MTAENKNFVMDYRTVEDGHQFVMYPTEQWVEPSLDDLLVGQVKRPSVQILGGAISFFYGANDRIIQGGALTSDTNRDSLLIAAGLLMVIIGVQRAVVGNLRVHPLPLSRLQ